MGLMGRLEQKRGVERSICDMWLIEPVSWLFV